MYSLESVSSVANFITASLNKTETPIFYLCSVFPKTTVKIFTKL